MHIGQGVCITKTQYDNCAVNAGTSNSKFVKNIALAVFSINELKGGSITGMACRRIAGAVAKPALDSTKLRAIKGIIC